jgi:hypothetical protein
MRIDSECPHYTMRQIHSSGGSAMRTLSLRSTISMLGTGTAVLCAAHLVLVAKATSAPRFHLEEATIADVHRAMLARQLTATLWSSGDLVGGSA